MSWIANAALTWAHAKAKNAHLYINNDLSNAMDELQKVKRELKRLKTALPLPPTPHFTRTSWMGAEAS
ncbi:hypothetical protein NECAME_17302 [Necator americanus]|uniref:Uncharacterized protein n=1 Tax=Necator americanus TaxID=51031 RepID=W2TS99_NECAM|nr:hypothetical protein NECAME_17302 [Necator americanus]ETN83991.1 hypothetical protein NECAME_17302 [Necator americanus]